MDGVCEAWHGTPGIYIPPTDSIRIHPYLTSPGFVDHDRQSYYIIPITGIQRKARQS